MWENLRAQREEFTKALADGEDEVYVPKGES